LPVSNAHEKRSSDVGIVQTRIGFIVDALSERTSRLVELLSDGTAHQHNADPFDPLSRHRVLQVLRQMGWPVDARKEIHASGESRDPHVEDDRDNVMSCFMDCGYPAQGFGRRNPYYGHYRCCRRSRRNSRSRL
jgi:hypothetical protein